VLCFDGDNAGRRAAERAMERVLPLLGPDRSVAVAFLPQGEDPDSLIRHSGADAVRGVVDGALPLVDAMWDFAVGGRALGTAEQWAGLWADLERQVATVADGQVRSLYRLELRRRFDQQFEPFRFAGRRRRSGAHPAAPGVRPPRIRDAALLEARIFLALMINHEFLLTEVSLEELSEILARLKLPVALEPLRGGVFAWLTHEPLDEIALGVHLKRSGLWPLVEEIAGPRTIEHARFVRPEASEDEVRAGWRDIWLREHRRGLDRELAAGRADVAAGDERALERISKLGERRAELGTAETSPRSAITDDGDDLARAVAEALAIRARDQEADAPGGHGR
jgi:DNA primase